MRLRAIAALALCLYVGCAGAPQHVQVNNDVAVTITPTPDTLPFDPRGARLREATDRLSGIVGHVIAFQFDAALLSQWRSGFEEQLITSIESVARALVAWKKDEPDGFVHSAPLLRRVECHYSALAEESKAALDADGGVLRVDQAAHATSLVPEGLVYEALEKEHDAFLERTFREGTPDGVAPASRRAYFAFLVGTRPGYGALYEGRFREAQSKLDAVGKLAASPHADVILKVLRLDALAHGSDADLEARARAWLWEQLSWYTYRYSGDQKELSQIGTGTLFRRAEAAFGAWLAAELPRASDEEKLQAAKHFFSSELVSCQRRACTVRADVFPGVDIFAFGLGIVDDWLRAGRPLEGGAGKRAELMDSIVCPFGRDETGKRSRSRGCSAGWLQRAVADDAGRKRLAEALDARGDAVLTDDVFANLRWSPVDATLALFHALDRNKPSWKAAATTLGEVQIDDAREAILAEASAIWKDAPARRGTALYLVAQAKAGYDRSYGDSYWGGFARSFGASIGEAELGGMLDQSPAAMVHVPELWAGLAKGFSRVDVLAPRLDAWIGDATQPRSGDRLRVVSAIVGRLCDDGATGDLGKLNAYLQRRVAAHPGEQRALTILLRDTASGGCTARKRSPEPADDAY